MHRRSVFLAALSLLPVPALAAEYHDPGRDLRLSLDVADAQVCVVRPASLRVAAACEGLNLAAVEAGLDAKILLMAMARRQEWACTIAIMAQPLAGRRPMAKDEARNFLRGVRQGAERQAKKGGVTVRGLEGGEADYLVLNGLQVLRYVLELPEIGSGPGAMVNYAVIGRQEVVAVMFSAEAARLADVRAIAEAMIKTLRMPTTGEARWPERATEANAYQLGHAIGRAAGMLLVVALICGAVILVVRAARKGRTPPPSSAPPGPSAP
jgi:hypothetical protein